MSEIFHNRIGEAAKRLDAVEQARLAAELAQQEEIYKIQESRRQFGEQISQELSEARHLLQTYDTPIKDYATTDLSERLGSAPIYKDSQSNINILTRNEIIRQYGIHENYRQIPVAITQPRSLLGFKQKPKTKLEQINTHHFLGWCISLTHQRMPNLDTKTRTGTAYLILPDGPGNIYISANGNHMELEEAVSKGTLHWLYSSGNESGYGGSTTTYYQLEVGRFLQESVDLIAEYLATLMPGGVDSNE